MGRPGLTMLIDKNLHRCRLPLYIPIWCNLPMLSSPIAHLGAASQRERQSNGETRAFWQRDKEKSEHTLLLSENSDVFLFLPAITPSQWQSSFSSLPSFGARLFCTVSKRALLRLLTGREIERETATGGSLSLETDEMSKCLAKFLSYWLHLHMAQAEDRCTARLRTNINCRYPQQHNNMLFTDQRAALRQPFRCLKSCPVQCELQRTPGEVCLCLISPERHVSIQTCHTGYRGNPIEPYAATIKQMREYLCRTKLTFNLLWKQLLTPFSVNSTSMAAG